MSWRVTIPASREQAEAVGHADDAFAASAYPPVLVADEPDPAKPDDWVIHAYFDRPPTDAELDELAGLGRGLPEIEALGEDDWVVMSQADLQPLRARRFYVYTPTHRGTVPAGAIPFEIDAGLAFGTGQHSTTSGCLDALDLLEGNDSNFTNIADIGTGTGLLAFAAMSLWPNAKCIATDIDAIAVDVARDNAAINRVKLGHGPGELLLTVADGMESPMLAARAPFDLLIANILAGPLVELAPAFVKALAPGATIILAGLLDSQADRVVQAYTDLGLSITNRGTGEWPVLVLKSA